MKRIINKPAFLVMSLIFVTFTSCMTPTTKKEYLTQFERFVDHVGRDHNDYNKSDWRYADERFEKFSHKWHQKFKDELSLSDELKVTALIVRYNSYKGVNKFEEFYNDILKDDVDKLKEKIQYYIDNDMDEDLEKLKQGAKQIGDSTLQAVKKIIEDIREK